MGAKADTVIVRFFAAAAHAAGNGEVHVDPAPHTPVYQLVQDAVPDPARAADLAAVLGVCSFLVAGQRVTNPATQSLADFPLDSSHPASNSAGKVYVDVLPPFAGG